MQLIGSRHDQDDKGNDAGDIQFGDVATQQQTVDVRCMGNAVELSRAGGFGSRGRHESEEVRQQWEEGKDINRGAMSGTDEILLPDVSPH